jgi:GTP-binding protein Era
MLRVRMRSGTVALVGRSNVGKSTFLNRALGEPLAIVTPRPQTTRDRLVGIAHWPEAELLLVDTPGLHRPKTELGRRMNHIALEAMRTADVWLLMTDVAVLSPRPRAHPESTLADLDPEDRHLLDQVGGAQPGMVILNKVDTLRNKAKLLPLVAAWADKLPGVPVVPGSMLDAEDVQRVLRELVRLVPEGPAVHEADDLTDQPTSFFVREYVREQVLLCTQGEVPHAVAVSIDEVIERRDVVVAKATIHVEKPGQRKILVGRGGNTIRELGMRARERIEHLLDRRVHLQLFVRVSPRWRDAPRHLAELGYETPSGEALGRRGKRGG